MHLGKDLFNHNLRFCIAIYVRVENSGNSSNNMTTPHNQLPKLITLKTCYLHCKKNTHSIPTHSKRKLARFVLSTLNKPCRVKSIQIDI